MTDLKHLQLTEELHAYLVAHGAPPDEIQRELIAVTARDLGPRAGMQIAPEQGAFLTFLVAALGATEVVEVGTFTGYSALCLARGLPEGGRLTCFDLSEEWVDVGRPFWERAGVADRIEVRIGPAIDGLRALPDDPVIDFAFIDADKTGYGDYYEELLRRLSPRGVIAVDNVLWSGRVVDLDVDDADTVALRAFNDRLLADDRVEQVMLPLADGVTLVRRRS